MLRWHEREQYDGIVFAADVNGDWRYVDDVTGLTSLDSAAQAVLDSMRRQVAAL